MCEKARDMGIKGVPLTIIDGKWAVSGGQSSDVFVQVRDHSVSFSFHIT
jgi:predicted DsbA family dithiol-disulfide isomerase